ncbi:MAG: nucleoside transporter [Acidobacteriota bacterium]
MSATTSAAEQLDKLYEFDREPVSDDRLLGASYFAGSYAGEHVAATEFVIGVLFVNWGASVTDIFYGLALGNVLAVLTWTLLCAPIAVDTRLTMYWYLRRIGGPYFTLLYNVLNALLFCVLAGCMITVSASALRIPLGIPAQVHQYPDDIRFVLLVLAVGAVVVLLAMLGFKRLADFATVCSPWMFLMFIAGAGVMLPALAHQAGMHSIDSVASFFEMGRKVIWTGVTPDGSPPMGFWKVAAFAWICNLAMHAGLSDMAIWRYAKKSNYGLTSGVGIFLGHYLAWICAGMMGVGAAILLNQPLASLDSGAIAYRALGWAGILAVTFAGWTTSNPTLYRSGLALQAITPNWSRARVTLIAGVATTIVACFPFVFTRMLDFVGIYGLLLGPAGAIVMAEHWLFPRLGYTRYWADYQNKSMNWPALIAWAAGIALALGLERTGTLHLFYLFIPVFAVTIAIYLVLAPMAGAKLPPPVGGENRYPKPRPVAVRPPVAKLPLNAAAKLAGVVAITALLVCLAIPFYGGAFEGPLLAATLVYFISGTYSYTEYRKNEETT